VMCAVNVLINVSNESYVVCDGCTIADF